MLFTFLITDDCTSGQGRSMVIKNMVQGEHYQYFMLKLEE